MYILNVDILTKRLTIYSAQRNEVISIAALVHLLQTPAVLFVDLNTCGLFLMDTLSTYGCEPKDVTAYDLRIYALYYYRAVLRDCEGFGFEIGQHNQINNLRYIEAINTFLNEQLKTSLYDYKLTSLAAVAMLLLKKYECPAFLDCTTETEVFVRRAFFGGRCELFNPGTHQDLYYYDFPSMYGSLLTEAFPSVVAETRAIASLGEVGPAFVEATIQQGSVMRIPILPYRSQNGVYYPSGIFRGVFWKEELEFFIENGGHVLSVHGATEVSEFRPIFRELATFLLELKEGGCLFAKRLLNSIYGRLAIRVQTTKTIVCQRSSFEQALSEGGVKKYAYYNNVYLVERPLFKKTTIKRNIVVGAIIPARARIKLLKLVHQALQLGAILVYMDTDCIFIKLGAGDSEDILNLVKFTYATRGTFFTEKAYTIYTKYGHIQRGAPKAFYTSFKRKAAGISTRPISVGELTH